jgi:transposase InsO family protein
MRALERAISARGTVPGLMFHSDRGVEYGAYRYQGLLQAHSILPSMNRPYTSQDNAHMESFFHSLKAELLHRREIGTEAELIAVLAGYIDRFYNVRWLHSSLGYHSPVEFEQVTSS